MPTCMCACTGHARLVSGRMCAYRGHVQLTMLSKDVTQVVLLAYLNPQWNVCTCYDKSTTIPFNEHALQLLAVVACSCCGTVSPCVLRFHCDLWCGCMHTACWSLQQPAVKACCTF
jgi:hypothetical protein